MDKTAYGYKVDPQKPRDPAGLRRDEVEAVIVKEIFCFYLTHSTTLFGLQKYLAERKIASPSGQKTWGLATLKGILTNPAYTGHLYMGRFSYSSPKVRRSATHLIGKSHDSSAVLPVEQWIEIGTIPAIIDKEEFQKVAEKLIQNRVQAKRNNKTKQYLLRAMVSCGWCNMASIARCLSSGHSYCVCTGKIKAKFLQPEQVCLARFAPADQLDELVWQDLCSLILNPIQIRQALERAYSGSWLPQALQARQQNLRKAQNSLTSQIERLTDAYLAATIPLVEYQKRRSDLENKKLILERQVEEL